MARQLDLPDLNSGTAFEHDLLATAFRLLLADGRPVTPARLAEALERDPAQVEWTLARLDQHGRLRRDQTGAVTGSHGLSVTATRHELLLALEQEPGRERTQQRRYWTWCAWDAVGILAALDANGRIRSASPASGAPIELEFHHGSPAKADPELVVFFADTDCCTPTTDTEAEAVAGCCAPVPVTSVIDDWCPLVNFFEHAAAAQAWATEHGVRGTAVGLAEATRQGKTAWTRWIA